MNSDEMQAWLRVKSCPRYESCSVPICPLDQDWRLRSFHYSEAVCPYLRESARPGMVERYAGRKDEHCLIAAMFVRPDMEEKYPAIARQVERSLASPSLIEQNEARLAVFAKARAQRAENRQA